MDAILKIVFAVVRSGHGVAHSVATFILGRQAIDTPKREAITIRSWLLPNLSSRSSAVLAMVFWLPAAVGSVAAVPLAVRLLDG